MDPRQLLLVSHRWLGLATSAILAVVGLTGAMLLWDLAILGPVGRLPSRLHERLALGAFGDGLVDLATILSLILQLGGLVLWWKRKTMMVRRGSGLWRTCFDLHHVIGVVFLPLMLLLAATAVVMAWVSPDAHPTLWRMARRLHTGHFSLPVEVIYGVASLGFVVQGLTGVVVWWKPRVKG